MSHMSEEGVHLWQVVQQQAAAMMVPGLSSMQQHLLALRACQLTANASQAAVQLVLDLIQMMHKEGSGTCGQMIDRISTPRLTNASHTGVTPGMQLVRVTQRSPPLKHAQHLSLHPARHVVATPCMRVSLRQPR